MKRSNSPGLEDDLQSPRKKLATSVGRIEATDDVHSTSSDVAEDWGLWGPYLSERQWGTVREDMSRDGNCWESLSHDASVRTAYRSGEDGLLGMCDRSCVMCTAVALWNHEDPCLKERLFGLANPQGNHGEDVKELYYYLDNNPQHSYMQALYRYPQQPFPYEKLLDENTSRDVTQPEYELLDTGVFDQAGYWDVHVEYAKVCATDLVCCVTVINQSTHSYNITVLPTVWFRNTWSDHNGSNKHKPHLSLNQTGLIHSESSIGEFDVEFYDIENKEDDILFTDNNTCPSETESCVTNKVYYKDAFHRFIIQDDFLAVNPQKCGTKCSAVYRLTVPPGGQRKIYWTICDTKSTRNLSVSQLEEVVNKRKAETKLFYSKVTDSAWSEEEKTVAVQAIAGLLWSKQFYMYDVGTALIAFQEIHSSQVKIQREAIEVLPPRNKNWKHLKNSDVIAVPDKWEFPWYAPWDLAFHVVSYIRLDVNFCKHQLELFLTDRYMKEDGQLPGCEFDLDDPNPPLHAWACLAIYRGDETRDLNFLHRCFTRLARNYTWWLTRLNSRHMYSGGGFLGMDNISVLNRSEAPPGGYSLLQADGTAWVALCSLNMLDMSLQLLNSDPKIINQSEQFLNNFLKISVQMNMDCNKGGLWHAHDKFFYDVLSNNEETVPIRVRSLVGLVGLIASSAIEIPESSNTKRLLHRIENCTDQEKQHIHKFTGNKYFFSLVPKSRLSTLMSSLSNSDMFLSPFGIRSLSKEYKREPYTLVIDKKSYTMTYAPGVSMSDMYGGNSNWRGPIWLCMNYLLMKCLDEAGTAYGSQYTVEHPVGSRQMAPLTRVAADIATRIVRLFLPGSDSVRPCFGPDDKFHQDDGRNKTLLFHEFFHAESGLGCGASHQTGWTALVVEFLHRKHRKT